MSQSVSNDPTAVVWANTMSALPVWRRTDVGDYLLSLDGAFAEDRTYVTITSGSDVNLDSLLATSISFGMVTTTDQLYFGFTFQGASFDSWFNYIITVRVYDTVIT